MTFTGFHRLAESPEQELFCELHEIAKSNSKFSNFELSALAHNICSHQGIWTSGEVKSVLELANALFEGDGVQDLSMQDAFGDLNGVMASCVRRIDLDIKTLFFDYERGRFEVITCRDFIVRWEREHE